MIRTYDSLTIGRTVTDTKPYEMLLAAVVRQSFDDMMALEDIRRGKATHMPHSGYKPGQRSEQYTSKKMDEILRFWRSRSFREMGFHHEGIVYYRQYKEARKKLRGYAVYDRMWR